MLRFVRREDPSPPPVTFSARSGASTRRRTILAFSNDNCILLCLCFINTVCVLRVRVEWANDGNGNEIILFL